ncbi:MAG: hypothetical protein KKE01_00040 [Candidatus Omnitrophica bacterium]|nr:hypothetical protein [Candidatus Omnitrophota bacterium]
MEEKDKELHVDTFILPENLGNINDSWKGNSDKIVLHIQDAHCNYAAQHKISEIIKYLNDEYGVDTINLEGGTRDYELSIFTKIYDKTIREKTADYFVKEGLINGAEYFAINNPEKATLWGIEDTKLYIDNLNVYRDSLKYKEEVDRHLDTLTYVLSVLKTKIYSQELLEFDIEYSRYKAGTAEFKDYLAYLIRSAKNKAIDIEGFTNICLTRQTLAEEGNINFKKANNQRDDLIDKLQKKLSKKSIEKLVLKTVEFKTGKTSQKEFYACIIDKAKQKDIALDGFAELQKYISYVSMYDAIDKTKTMYELEKLEDSIKESLFKNDKQKELNRLFKNLVILKNMFSVTLTKDDYRYYINNRGSFSAANYTTFINSEAPLYKITTRPDENITDIDRYRENISRFYKYSFKRDDMFLKNIKFTALSSRAPQGRSNLKNISILITGGFHTENLCETFKKKNISYVSIMPNFKNNDGYECPYFRLLKGDVTKIEKMIYDTFTSLPASSIAIAALSTPLGPQALGIGWPGSKEMEAARASFGGASDKKTSDEGEKELFEEVPQSNISPGLWSKSRYAPAFTIAATLLSSGGNQYILEKKFGDVTVRVIATLGEVDIEDVVGNPGVGVIVVRAHSTELKQIFDPEKTDREYYSGSVWDGQIIFLGNCGRGVGVEELVKIRRSYPRAIIFSWDGDAVGYGMVNDGVLNILLKGLAERQTAEKIKENISAAYPHRGAEILFPSETVVPPSGTFPETLHSSKKKEFRVITVRGKMDEYWYFNPAMLPSGNLIARRVSREEFASTGKFHISELVVLEPVAHSGGLEFIEKEALERHRGAEDPRIMAVHDSKGEQRLGMTYVVPRNGGVEWNSWFVFIDEAGKALSKPVQLGRPDMSSKNTYLTDLADGKVALIDRANGQGEKLAIQLYIFDSLEEALNPPAGYWEAHSLADAKIIGSVTAAGREYSHVGFNTIVERPGYKFKIAIIHLADVGPIETRLEEGEKRYSTAIVFLDSATMKPLGEPVVVHDAEKYVFPERSNIPGVIYETAAPLRPEDDTLISYAGVGDSSISMFEESLKDIISRYIAQQSKDVREKIRKLIDPDVVKAEEALKDDPEKSAEVEQLVGQTPKGMTTAVQLEESESFVQMVRDRFGDKVLFADLISLASADKPDRLGLVDAMKRGLACGIGEDRSMGPAVIRSILSAISNLEQSVHSELQMALRTAVMVDSLGAIDKTGHVNMVVQIANVGESNGARSPIQDIKRNLEKYPYNLFSQSIIEEGINNENGLFRLIDRIITFARDPANKDPKALLLLPEHLHNCFEQAKDYLKKNNIDIDKPDALVKIQKVEQGSNPDLVTQFGLGFKILEYVRQGEKAEPSQELLNLIAAMVDSDINPRDILDELFKTVLKIRRIDWDTIGERRSAWEAVATAL